MSTESERSKEIVLLWLTALQEGPEKAAEGITEDFRWVLPQSAAEEFGFPRELRGVEGLQALLSMDEKIYKEKHLGDMNMHFAIAEGDRVAIQMDYKATTMKGELYHNFYCFTFRVEGEKVAEVWEHADTLYVYRKCLQ